MVPGQKVIISNILKLRGLERYARRRIFLHPFARDEESVCAGFDKRFKDGHVLPNLGCHVKQEPKGAPSISAIPTRTASLSKR